MELHPIRVVQYGLGEIGRDVARLMLHQPGLSIVGGIDRDPAKVGHDIGEILGLDKPMGMLVSDDAPEILRQTRPDVVMLTTTSLFHQIYPQVLECVRARANVISSCE